MKKLLIATWNPAKLEMFKNLLDDIDDIEILTLADFEKIDEPVEDWDTVEENALIKARYYCEAFWVATLSDDAWFEIHELDWIPWVKARRWWWELHENTSDEDWLNHFLEKINHVEKEMLNWSFPFARCLYLPDWRYYFQKEYISIRLSKTPRIPFKAWWPLSSVVHYHDGRHQLDIPDDDPFWHEQVKKDWLIKLVENL